MSVSDQVFDTLLVLVWLGTPLVFAASLFYQAENRVSRLSLPKLPPLISFANKEGEFAKGEFANGPDKQNELVLSRIWAKDSRQEIRPDERFV